MHYLRARQGFAGARRALEVQVDHLAYPGRQWTALGRIDGLIQRCELQSPVFKLRQNRLSRYGDSPWHPRFPLLVQG